MTSTSGQAHIQLSWEALLTFDVREGRFEDVLENVIVLENVDLAWSTYWKTVGQKSSETGDKVLKWRKKMENKAGKFLWKTQAKGLVK